MSEAYSSEDCRGVEIIKKCTKKTGKRPEQGKYDIIFGAFSLQK
jgi:hypothetical protein